jgi:hypothetical protein
MQAIGKGLGKPQSQGARLPASCINQALAEKAMQSSMIFPDGLSEPVR